MTGDPEAAVSAGAHALFFPCGVGHMLGLDAHDMENLGEDIVGYAGQPRSSQFGLSSLRLARPLEPSFVVTVEPGIYFNRLLADRWQSLGLHTEFVNYDRLETYWGFGGYRVEDDYVVTADGSRRLGTDFPRTASAIEELMQGS
jgi:Xaa-Pro aminopeptidase